MTILTSTPLVDLSFEMLERGSRVREETEKREEENKTMTVAIQKPQGRHPPAMALVLGNLR